MALRKFNAKKYNIAKLTRKEEIGSKPIRCGFTPLPKPEPVVPVAKPKKAPTPKVRAKKSTK